MRPPGSITTRESKVIDADELTGVEIRQLTDRPRYNTTVYMDACYCDPSSRYVMFLRGEQYYPGPAELWRADLHEESNVFVTGGISWWQGVCMSPDQRYFYSARRPHTDVLEVIRTEVATLDQHFFEFPCSEPLTGNLATASLDNRFLIMAAWLAPHRYGMVRFDLHTGAREIIHEGGDELLNSNPLIEPGEGRLLLVQNNRGGVSDDAGNIMQSTGPQGAALYVFDMVDGSRTDLPVGRPHTGAVGGHSSWINGSGALLTNIYWDSTEQTREKGSLAVCDTTSKDVRFLGQGYCCCHCNASRDGRYFASDTVAAGAPDDDPQAGRQLVMGAFSTGKTRVLCSTGALMDRPQYTHPHPWITADNRWVVFNSMRTGAPQVNAARVPESMLNELEDDS